MFQSSVVSTSSISNRGFAGEVKRSILLVTVSPLFMPGDCSRTASPKNKNNKPSIHPRFSFSPLLQSLSLSLS